jgi:flagellum-specific ATP synthase
MPAGFHWEYLQRVVQETQTIPLNGRVSRIVGLLIEGRGPGAKVGSQCLIYPQDTDGEPIVAEVVGFRDKEVLFMPYGETRGIGPGCRILSCGDPSSVQVGEELLGRVLDGLGQPLDGKGPIMTKTRYPLYAPAPHPLKRALIKEPLDLGIRSINGLLTCGKGQRVGIFAGSGVGKSTLLGMMARFTRAHVNVIALIGERGREVREFIERDLGEEGMKRSVVVVATSDQPPLVRMRGAFVATAIAEFFRDQGMDVLLLMDSLTRFAMAQREVGLSAGEPPTTKGYTPSVFAAIPRLLERAGMSEGKGSITGLYAVLVESDDFNEPISDAVRSILDGHIQLSRELANYGHYPAVDVLGSVSRVMREVVDDRHMAMAGRFLEILAVYKRVEDLIQLGAYTKGSDPRVDEAINCIDGFNRFLRQGINEPADMASTLEGLRGVLPGQGR